MLYNIIMTNIGINNISISIGDHIDILNNGITESFEVLNIRTNESYDGFILTIANYTYSDYCLFTIDENTIDIKKNEYGNTQITIPD